MKPHKVTFYVYANTEEQVQELQQALNGFVRDKYNVGVIVTATKLADALRKFGNNLLVNNFLKW